MKIGVAPGDHRPRSRRSDFVADNMDRVLAEDELVFPQQVFEEIALMLQAQS